MLPSRITNDLSKIFPTLYQTFKKGHTQKKRDTKELLDSVPILSRIAQSRIDSVPILSRIAQSRRWENRGCRERPPAKLWL